MAPYILLGGLFLFMLFTVFRLKRMVRDGKEALEATGAMCDAEAEFFNWLRDDPLNRHSGVEFRERARKVIRAKKRFADTHPNTDMEPSIVLWNTLIDENK